MDWIKCNICETFLTTEELKLLKINSIAQSIGKVTVCKKHWCNCMPKRRPYKWIKMCFKCKKRMHCELCCGYDNYTDLNLVCSSCSQKN